MTKSTDSSSLLPRVTSGQMFTYREKSRLLRRQSGAGQILGSYDDGRVIFLRIFDLRGERLRTLIRFLPIISDAFQASDPHVIKAADLPPDWDRSRAEWEEKRQRGEAGVFTRALKYVTTDVFETVDYFRDIPAGQTAFIELAYPKKSASKRFDTVAAVVRNLRE